MQIAANTVSGSSSFKYILFILVYIFPNVALVTLHAQETITSTFAADDSNFYNPERGLHSEGNLLDNWGFAEAKAEGYSLARTYVRLDEYLDSALPASLLQNLDEGFETVRLNGVKVVLRFSYNFGFDGFDTNIDRVEQHIRQLTPLLRDNADVIAVVQAGFVGAWGEWHGSDFDLDSDINKARVHAALMAAVPDDRMVQIRTPGDIEKIYPQSLTQADYFGITSQSRTGHHNDCFLSNTTDSGTYSPSNRLNELQNYLVSTTGGVAVGGETCQVSPEQHRTDCATALEELNRFNWDYLNVGFYRPDLERWQVEGCFDEIVQRLGYRFRMIEASTANVTAPGDTLSVVLKLANDGFGKLYNPRPAYLILRNSDSGDVTRLPVNQGEDFRRLQPLSGNTRDLALRVKIPEQLSQGRYELLLELPDAASSLADNPDYSIRMANTGVWQEDNGFNNLDLQITIADTLEPPDGPVVADSCNLLENGSLDSDAAGWFSSSRLIIVADAQSGAGALRIEAGSASTSVHANEGVAYTISGFARSGGGLGWAGLGVDFLDQNRNELGEVFTAVPVSRAYQIVRLAETSPPGTRYLRLWVYASNNRSINIDEFAIRADGCDETCNALANGSFENGTDSWSGSSSLQLSRDASDGDLAAQITAGSMSTVVPVQPGTPYSLTGNYKSTLSSDWSGYGIDYLDAASEEIAEEIKGFRAVGRYANTSISGVVPDDAVAMRVWIHAPVSRVLTVDNWVLKDSSCVR